MRFGVFNGYRILSLYCGVCTVRSGDIVKPLSAVSFRKRMSAYKHVLIYKLKILLVYVLPFELMRNMSCNQFTVPFPDFDSVKRWRSKHRRVLVFGPEITSSDFGNVARDVHYKRIRRDATSVCANMKKKKHCILAI